MKRARLSLSSIPALMAFALSSNVALAREAPQPTWGAASAPEPPLAEPVPSPLVTGPSPVVLDVPAPPPPAAAPSLVVPIEAPPAPAVPVVAPTPSLADFVPAPSLPTAPPEPEADRSVSSPGPRRHIVGMAMDVGVPDGAGLGLSVRPVDWLRVAGSVTHNSMAPGVRAGITLDPMPTPVAITLTVEGGHYWSGRVPGIQSAPSVAYNYANFHAGLEFGDRSSFRFFLHGGASWLDLNASASQSALASLSNLSYRGWMAPSAKLGFSLHF